MSNLSKFRLEPIFFLTDISCPQENGTYYLENRISDNQKTASYGECSQLCRSTLHCVYWAWLPDDQTQAEENRKKCILHSQRSGPHMVKDTTAITGMRNCRTCVTVGGYNPFTTFADEQPKPAGTCQTCEDTFTTRTALKKHIKSKHNRHSLRVPLHMGKQDFQQL